MATIYYAIEAMWTRDNFRATLTINDADLEGLEQPASASRSSPRSLGRPCQS